jgi:branched-chain amino acid transport system substrate-binding protein
VIACGDESKKPAQIHIGVIAYIDQETERISTLNAARMAVEAVNDTGGLKVDGKRYRIVTIIEEVKGAVPEQAVAAVRKLINQENVVVIIGPQFSTDAIPAGEVAENSRVPLISPISTNPSTTAGRKYVFRLGFTDEIQGAAVAAFSRADLTATRAAVLYNVANPYSHGIAQVFRKKFESEGGTVAAFESYTTDQKNYTPQLQRIKAVNPHVLFLPNFSKEAREQAREARQLGIDAVLIGSDGWNRQEFKGLSQFDGTYMTAHWSSDMPGERVQSFVKEYETKFERVPGDTAALTYDAFYLVFAAIENQGKTDAQSIQNGLYELGPFTGVGGSLDFTDSGDPSKQVVILKIRSGKVIFHKRISP